MDCIAAGDGKVCVRCGWQWNGPDKFPRHNCNTVVAGYRHNLCGSNLYALIHRYFGEESTMTCGCNEMIAKMNAWGPAGTMEHLDEIVGHIMSQGDERGWWKMAKKAAGRILFGRKDDATAIG